jgi:hypothetical protein
LYTTSTPLPPAHSEASLSRSIRFIIHSFKSLCGLLYALEQKNVTSTRKLMETLFFFYCLFFFGYVFPLYFLQKPNNTVGNLLDSSASNPFYKSTNARVRIW